MPSSSWLGRLAAAHWSIAAVVLVSIVAGMALWTRPPAAEAHGGVEQSSPAAGAVLQAPPSSVSITFSNDVQKIAGTYAIEVNDAGGASVIAAPATIADDNRSLMQVNLQPSLPNGRYVVRYKNVSDTDGDPFEGGFAFYIGVQPTPQQLAEDALLQPAAETPAAATSTPTRVPVVGTPSAATPTRAGGGNDDGGDSKMLPTLVFVGVTLVVAAVVAMIIWRAARGRPGEV